MQVEALLGIGHVGTRYATDVVLQFRSVRLLIAQDQLAQIRREVANSSQPVVICDAAGPTFLLKHWARDRTRGPKLPLEQLVKKQTLLERRRPLAGA